MSNTCHMEEVKELENVQVKEFVSKQKKGFYERFVKRPLDFILALLMLIILSPVFTVVAVLVRIKLGSPVIFKQKRPGLNEEIFCMYKFRTMTDERDENGELLSDEMRLTKFGKLLRSTSLDELPQLINIMKGECSLVGVRALLTSYLPRYSPEQHRRHEVRPGLTGYAQAYGRNSLTWEEKFKKDVYYVDHVSFLLDVKILFKTVAVVLKREGISSETSATMEEFMGNESGAEDN